MTEVRDHSELDGYRRDTAEAARAYRDLEQHVPGDSFAPEQSDMTNEQTAPLPVFYHNIAENLGYEIQEARQQGRNGDQAHQLVRSMLRHAHQPPTEIPVEGGRETITQKDHVVRHAVGEATYKAARTMMDPEYSGNEFTLYDGDGANTVQNSAIYSELEGIFDLQPTDERNQEYDSLAVPGVHIRYGAEHPGHPGQRIVYMRIDRDANQPAESSGHAPRHGRHAEEPEQAAPDLSVPGQYDPELARHYAETSKQARQGPRPNLTRQDPAPRDPLRYAWTEQNPAVDGQEPRRGRHEFQPANQGSAMYQELLRLTPTEDQAWGPDGPHYARAIRERLRERIGDVNEHPLPQLEHDQSGETTAQLEGTMRRALTFIDPRARGERPNHSVIYQGGDPREDPAGDLVRMELLKLLGNVSHHTHTRRLDRGSVTSVDIATDVGGIMLQIQILDGYGFDGHHRPGSRMRISLKRHPHEWSEA